MDVFLSKSNEFECLLPQDMMGLLWKKDDVKELIEGLTAYVEKYPDSLVEDAHKEFHERHFGLSVSGSSDYYQKVDKPLRKKKKGFVYLMISRDGYKIGRSWDPKGRLKELKRSAPSLELIHTFEADDVLLAEKTLHRRFADRRISGEWFDLSPGEVEGIKKIVGFEDEQFLLQHTNEVAV